IRAFWCNVADAPRSWFPVDPAWGEATGKPPIRSPSMSDIIDPPPVPSEAEAPSAEARQWALFAHLSALAGILIPFGNILGPLIIWQIKKAEMPFVDDQGKEALNFQITVAIAMIVSMILMLVLIGVVLMFLV